MARHYIDFRDPNGGIRGPSNIEPYLVSWRDKFRAALSGTDFTVSDIAKWDGQASNEKGYGFVVKNGSLEWFFMRGDTTNFSLDIGEFFANDNSSDVQAYWKSTGNLGSMPSTTDRHLAIHHNFGVGSYGMGFDDGAALTYSGGDFSTPAFSPYADPFDFMPVDEQNSDTIPYGLVCDSPYDDEFRDDSTHLVIFDDTVNTLIWYTSAEDYPIKDISMLGTILSNYDGADTNEMGLFTLEFNPISSSIGNISSTTVQAFDAAGVPDIFDIVAHQNFTPDNRKTAGGDFLWNSVQVKNSSYTKGLLKTDLVRVVGAFEARMDYRKLFAGPNGPFYLATENLAFPYVSGIERFPYPVD